jgi:ubiquitin carboxyl-terminal hydrolase 14
LRFYWKEASAVGGTDAGKAKILRQVTFPKVFDLFEFCTDELKTSLLQGRNLDAAAGGDVEMADEEEKKEEAPKKLVGAMAKAAKVQEEIKAHDDLLYRSFNSGLDTGQYQLIGVVTHKGRSADGGHYIGWVHASGDDWL